MNSVTGSLEMAAATSKWKKIEHSILFISASKNCARASKCIVEIKKQSKWKKLRWDFQFQNIFLYFLSQEHRHDFILYAEIIADWSQTKLL